MTVQNDQGRIDGHRHADHGSVDHRAGVGLTRRRLLAGAGALSAGALSTGLAGCSTASSGGAAGSTKDAAALPQHIPAPKIEGEVRSRYEGLPSAYPAIPDPLRKARTDKPGDGTSMSFFTIIWGPPAPPPEQNPYWTEMNKRLGLKLDMVWGPSDSYDAKLATLLASGELPDVTVLLPNPTADKALRQGAFADLTEVLAGDKMKQYPSLANNIGEDAWKNTLIDGRVMGVVCPVPAVDTIFTYRGDWAKKIGLSVPPKDDDELYEYLTGIPKAIPSNGGPKPYGVGGFPGPFMGLVRAMFRVGPGWQRDPSGKLIADIDTDAYEEMLTWCRKLWQGGGLHPDALALDKQEIKTIAMFEAGQLGFMKSGLSYPFSSSSPLFGLEKKNPEITGLLPPSHGGQPAQWVKTTGWFSRWGISAKSAKDPKRLDTILKTLDWLSAPFGTEEYMFNRFGIEGRQWNYNSKHEPVPVDDAKIQSEIGGLSQYPHAYYFPGSAHGYRDALDYAEAMMKNAVDDPIASIPSEVGDRVGGVLEKITDDYVNQIVSGRRPLSDLQTFRSEWHKRGGDQYAADLEKRLAGQ